MFRTLRVCCEKNSYDTKITQVFEKMRRDTKAFRFLPSKPFFLLVAYYRMSIFEFHSINYTHECVPLLSNLYLIQSKKIMLFSYTHTHTHTTNYIYIHQFDKQRKIYSKWVENSMIYRLSWLLCNRKIYSILTRWEKRTTNNIITSLFVHSFILCTFYSHIQRERMW